VQPGYPQPRSRRLLRATAHGGTGVLIGRNAGGHGEAGMESEEGTAFESLPRRNPCRNMADQPFLISTLNPQFHASMVLQVSVAVEIDMRVQSRTLPKQRELEPVRDDRRHLCDRASDDALQLQCRKGWTIMGLVPQLTHC
jgi:hypothetical protein